uniref:uncharacterized protein LOC105350121 n=1 Tax=Fragaria vesca subsp. vesca TaxID=101020 RepID=UPI0005C7E94D|nr:PREDICTED: uncharacterized protein LOC105350121 [Fragaria vesca subsp. vesca]
MKNHQSRPTGSKPLPEANDVHNSGNGNQGRGRHGNARGRGHRGGRGRHNGAGRNGPNNYLGQRTNGKITKGKGPINTTPKKNANSGCHRCGGDNHWARTCRTPPHLVELYKASLSKKNVETNFIDHSDPWDTMDQMDDTLMDDNPIDITPLSISDYLVDNGSNDMFSDGIINNN